jgi:hypothetical protein
MIGHPGRALSDKRFAFAQGMTTSCFAGKTR